MSRFCLRPRLVLLLILLAFTLLFIWSNSLRPAELSTAQSDSFGNFFKQIFDIEREPFRFLYENRRKVAHFAEFALLGGETCLLLTLGGARKQRSYWCGALFCLLAAALDEGIQFFVPGRVCAFFDLCIDAAGSLFGMFAVGALAYLCFRFRHACHTSRSE